MTTTEETLLKRRADGRSNQQVLIDHVQSHADQPGKQFTYEELSAVLGSGTDRDFDRVSVQQVVRAAREQLLRQHKRTLVCVPNVGYHLAHAREHKAIASAQTRRGHRQMKRALSTMENARLDEMTATERELHLAQCQINSQLYHEQRRMLSKQQRHDDMIARLTSRVEQLEAKADDKTDSRSN